MNKLLYISWLFLLFTSCQLNDDLSIYSELNRVLEQRDVYKSQKTDRINELLAELASSDTHGGNTYILNQSLHEAYFSFENDSAVYYANEMCRIAEQQNDSLLLFNAKIKIAATLIRAGMFVEVKDLLESIPENSLENGLLSDYYKTKALLYFDLYDKHINSCFSTKYRDRGEKSLELAIASAQVKSIDYYSLNGFYYLRKGDFASSAANYATLFEQYTPKGRQFAVEASTYAYILGALGLEQKCLEWRIYAAIEDVKYANRENTALKYIGNSLFEEGYVNLASRYLDIALNDAKLYGAKLRQEELALIMPSVEAAKVRMIEHQKKRIQRFAILSSILICLVITVLILLFRQLKKVNDAKSLIQKQNDAIKETNDKLREENLIKEEYIGFSFKTSSDLIQKLDEIRQEIENKLRSNKFEEIKKVLSRGVIKKERDHFFESFDKTFLSIFPEFVINFNKLFTEENKFIDNNSKTLNTELRIFALIRLGIHDSERISQILNYSINTINTYKSKIKNRSLINNHDFEDEIRKIESI